MLQPAVLPPAVMPSIYGPPPRRTRPAHLPGMVSVGVTELFPEMARGFLQGEGIEAVRSATKKALADVDMRKIKPEDKVNILCSEHGFYILEGLHYREMLKALGDEVFDRTGCRNIRYVLASGMGIKETDEVIDYFDLKEYFNFRTRTTHPFDAAVAIETEIGTLYGLKKVHGNFSNRSANFLQKAIFDSPFVQEKFVFACILRSTPDGITGVNADNDLYRLDRRISKELLRDYGKVLRLVGEIDECIAVWDAGRWGYYIHAGGIAFGCLENGRYDAFDLDIPSAMGFHDTLEKYFKGEIKALDTIMNINPAIRAVVINQAWPGLPISDVPRHVPTVVVGRDQADLLNLDSTNPDFMNHAVISDTLETAMEFAHKIAGTDKVIVFDGSFGYFTVSRTMADSLMEKAGHVGRQVEEHYLPLWLKQRGLNNCDE
jgi:hypothetical protein